MINLDAIVAICRQISKISDRIEGLIEGIKDCKSNNDPVKLVFADQLIGQIADMQQLFLSLTDITLPKGEDEDAEPKQPQN